MPPIVYLPRRMVRIAVFNTRYGRQVASASKEWLRIVMYNDTYG